MRVFWRVLGVIVIWAVALTAAIPAVRRTAQDAVAIDANDANIALYTVMIGAIGLNGGNPSWALVRRGIAYALKHDYDRAIADYTDAIALNPRSALTYFDRALAHGYKRETDLAIDDYSEAIRLNPRYGLAYKNRAYAYRIKGDRQRAIDDFSQAINLSVGDAWTYTSRGVVREELGDHDGAIADFTTAIQIDDKYALAYAGRGHARLIKDRRALALADLDEAIRLDTTNSRAYLDRAWIHGKAGDADRAIADYGAAIRLAPQYAWIYASRGRLLVSTGQSTEALADFDRAAELEPNGAYHALWREIAARRAGSSSQLSAAAEKLDLAQWPGPVVRLYLGRLTPADLLTAADNPDPVKKREQVCEANFYTAAYVLMRDDRSAAIRLFRLAAADCPHNFIEFDAALAELKALGVATAQPPG